MKHELIGKKVELVYGKTKYQGIIIDETKNMIVLETRNELKKFIKKTIKIIYQNQEIEGIKITKRPESRIKAC